MHDKEAFRNTFIRLFETRANWMDSIVVDPDADELDVKVKFPGTDECAISGNGIYVALYKFKDSIRANQYFKKLQVLLNYAAGAYNARMRFQQINKDPYNLQYYISDSLGFIDSYSTISLYKDEKEEEENDDDDQQKTKKPDKFFIVNMTIDGETTYNYFTSTGDKKNDTAVTRLIKDVAFGKDIQMASIKINKRTVDGAAVYGSRRTLKGYTAEIGEEEYNKAVHTTLQLTHSFTGTGDQLVKKAEDLLLNIKAALPDSYCYTVDGQTVYFFTHPFANTSPDATLTIEYFIDKEKEDLMHLVLSISREMAKPN